MRATVPELARSSKKSLPTTTPRSAAPANHGLRSMRRRAITIATIAVNVHSSENAACTVIELKSSCAV